MAAATIGSANGQKCRPPGVYGYQPGHGGPKSYVGDQYRHDRELAGVAAGPVSAPLERPGLISEVPERVFWHHQALFLAKPVI
jgi:hypothetical protein